MMLQTLGTFLSLWGLLVLALLKVTALVGVAALIVGAPLALLYGAYRFRRRLFVGVVVALVLAGGAVSQAQIICTVPCPVWDVTAVLRTETLQGIAAQIDALSQKQGELFYKMAWRLQQFIPLGGYRVSPDNRPEWRIFDWFSEAVIVAQPYHRSLSYGDRNGDGFTAVSRPRPATADVMAQLPANAAEEIRYRQALIDLLDSIIIRGTDEAGLLRYNGRATQGLVDSFQDDVLKDDNDESTTAVLDKIAAAKLIHLRDAEVREKLKATELELALVDNIHERDRGAAAVNRFITRERDGGQTANALVRNARTPANGGQP
jgi:hypothetical protein